MDNKIYFTFDDGPDPEHTPRILDLLDQFHVQGFFFVLGHKVRQFPQLLEDIHRRNHVIGNHSYSHCRFYLTTARKMLAEIRATDEAIQAVTGQKPLFFRPPQGRFGIGLIRILMREDKKLLLWNLDSQDYRNCLNCERIIRRCQTRLRPGAILLFHDGHANSRQTVLALGAILQQAKDRGLIISG